MSEGILSIWIYFYFIFLCCILYIASVSCTWRSVLFRSLENSFPTKPSDLFLSFFFIWSFSWNMRETPFHNSQNAPQQHTVQPLNSLWYFRCNLSLKFSLNDEKDIILYYLLCLMYLFFLTENLETNSSFRNCKLFHDFRSQCTGCLVVKVKKTHFWALIFQTETPKDPQKRKRPQ